MAIKRTKAAPEADRPLTREIRSAIADDGRTPYALAKDSGVDESAIRRFVSRERSMGLESADRLASALGLQLVRRARSRARPRADTPPGVESCESPPADPA